MTDARTVLLVVGLLGLCAVASIAGAVFLLASGKAAEAVVGIAATAVGALAAVLASTRTKEPPGGGP